MARKSIKEQLQSEIEMAMAEVTECRDKTGYWQDRLTTAENELDRLRGALNALEGRPEQPTRAYPGAVYNLVPANAFDVGGPANVHPAPQTTSGIEGTIGTPPPKMVKIGDEEVILEPGFKLAKNSMGEDCIVPEGLDLKPMAEPVKPVGALVDGEYMPAPAISLPPVTPEDSFGNPEDLLNG